MKSAAVLVSLLFAVVELTNSQGSRVSAQTAALLTPATPTTQSLNPKLEARLCTMLPPGMTIQEAAYGFKNWGQLIAAAHVSNNLNIPFTDLKARLTGIPPGTPAGAPVLTTPMSLAQAIQSFKGTPTMDTATFSSTRVRNEVKRAEDAATAALR